MTNAGADGQDIALTWEETGYRREGTRDISFDGVYQATVSGDVMACEWYQGKGAGKRLVARFSLKAEPGRGKRS